MSDLRISKSSSKKIAKTKKVAKNESLSTSTFTNLLHEKDEQKQKENLEKMMKEISEKGKKLIETRNVETLVVYKKMIKDYIEEATKYAFKIIDNRGFGRIGRSKILKVVSAVDEKLIDITEEFLKEERQKINLLGKIGELEGLLTDFYI